MIRGTRPGEREIILALYPLAFPDEDLRPLVSALLDGEDDTLSLAAFAGKSVIGHVLFTPFADAKNPQASRGALLGPLGVVPHRQRQGLGDALVRAGLERLDDVGVAQVFVLGAPAYYGRFGFHPEKSVLPPYDLPPQWEGAWQSLTLSARPPLSSGRCTFPAPWMQPALWLP